MGSGEGPRRVVFAVVLAVLVLSGVVFSGTEFGTKAHSEGRAKPTQGAWSTPAAQQLMAETTQLRRQVERTASRFLAVYFRYEVGEIDAGVRREVRSIATPQFATLLLANPPRPPAGSGFPPPAELQRLNVTFVTADASGAIVSGSALRGGAPEEFSFQFELLQGAWRASGVPE